MSEKIYFRVYPETALNCLVGKPAKCIWETSVTGYRATIWDMTDDVFYPGNSRVFSTHNEAETWGKKQIKNR